VPGQLPVPPPAAAAANHFSWPITGSLSFSSLQGKPTRTPRSCSGRILHKTRGLEAFISAECRFSESWAGAQILELSPSWTPTAKDGGERLGGQKFNQVVDLAPTFASSLLCMRSDWIRAKVLRFQGALWLGSRHGAPVAMLTKQGECRAEQQPGRPTMCKCLSKWAASAPKVGASAPCKCDWILVALPSQKPHCRAALPAQT